MFTISKIAGRVPLLFIAIPLLGVLAGSLALVLRVIAPWVEAIAPHLSIRQALQMSGELCAIPTLAAMVIVAAYLARRLPRETPSKSTRRVVDKTVVVSPLPFHTIRMTRFPGQVP